MAGTAFWAVFALWLTDIRWRSRSACLSCEIHGFFSQQPASFPTETLPAGSNPQPSKP
jgi:hypothetical protein